MKKIITFLIIFLIMIGTSFGQTEEIATPLEKQKVGTPFAVITDNKCGNNICDLGETMENCQSDCYTPYEEYAFTEERALTIETERATARFLTTASDCVKSKYPDKCTSDKSRLLYNVHWDSSLGSCAYYVERCSEKGMICENLKCIIPTSGAQSCSESTYPDKCKDISTLLYGIHWSSTLNSCAYYTKICPSGTECRWGQCAASTKYCQDSDGGKNIMIKGTVTAQLITTETRTDSCAGNYVTEYYCSNGVLSNENILCPSGTQCSDGYCQDIGCTKSQYPDICKDTSTLLYGIHWSSTLNSCAYYKKTCQSGTICKDGQCVTDQISETCTKSKYPDKCTSDKSRLLYDIYWDSGFGSCAYKVERCYEKGQICENNACVTPDQERCSKTTYPDNCKDSSTLLYDIHWSTSLSSCAYYKKTCPQGTQCIGDTCQNIQTCSKEKYPDKCTSDKSRLLYNVHWDSSLGSCAYYVERCSEKGMICEDNMCKATSVCGNNICEDTESPETCPSDCDTAPPIPPSVVCGNNICEGGESPETCPSDCSTPTPPTTVCGNNICERDETASNCPNDCDSPSPAPPTACGNNICEQGETETSCSNDCGTIPPPECFTDVDCEEGKVCKENKCVVEGEFPLVTIIIILLAVSGVIWYILKRKKR